MGYLSRERTAAQRELTRSPGPHPGPRRPAEIRISHCWNCRCVGELPGTPLRPAADTRTMPAGAPTYLGSLAAGPSAAPGLTANWAPPRHNAAFLGWNSPPSCPRSVNRPDGTAWVEEASRRPLAPA